MPTQPLNSLSEHIRKLEVEQSYRQFADHELLRRFIRTKDETAFAVLFRRHAPKILGVCRRALGDIHSAEDACQASFLVLAERAATIRKSASLPSWLHGVALHVIANLKREHSRRSMREQRDLKRTPSDPAVDVTWREAQVILDEEIQRLPASLRAPLILCFLEGHTRDQAAKELKVTLATLHGRLERGRRLLRDRLTRRGLTLPGALVVAFLGESAMQAALSPALVLSTVNSAVMLAARGAPDEAFLSSNVLAPTKEVVRIMSAKSVQKRLIFALLGAFLTATASLAFFALPRPAVEEVSRTSEQPPPTLPGQPHWQERLQLQGNAGSSFCEFAPNGRIMTTTNDKNALIILDTATWQERGRFDLGAPYGKYYTMHTPFSADGRYVAFYCGVPKTKGSTELRPETIVLETANGKAAYRFPGRLPSFSAAGNKLATIENDTIALWDLATGKQMHRLATGGEIAELASREPAVFSPDGTYFFAQTKTGRGKLWNVSSGKEIATLTGFLPVWSPDSRVLTTIAPGPVVHLWDAQNGAERAKLQGFSQPGCVVAFSPDGRSLVTCTYESGLKPDGSWEWLGPHQSKTIAIDIRLWDTSAGKELQRLPGQTRLSRGASFSPDGRTILYLRQVNGSAYQMEGVVWDVAASKDRCVIRDPAGVDSLQFTPDGSAVIGEIRSSSQRSLRSWDPATGRLLPGQPPSSEGGEYYRQMSPDGKVLALSRTIPEERGGGLRIYQWSDKLLVKETRGEAPPMKKEKPVEQPVKSPAAQALEAIQNQTQAAGAEFGKQYTAAANEAARNELGQKYAADLADFVAKARELARTHPQDRVAAEALEFALRNVTDGALDGPVSEQNIQTLTLIREQFLKAPIMDRLVPLLTHNHSPEAEALLQSVLESHPQRQVRGRAAYWLAYALSQQAESAALIRQMPEILNRPKVKQNSGTIRRLQSTDPVKTAQRAEALYELLRKDYADVKLYDFKPGDLGPASARALFALRNLTVGKTAPEIEGKDLDGRKFKLSDYRGKVVVLFFCGHWCGPCRQMNPSKQELVKRHAGKPFALLEVNSDNDPDEWKAMMKRQGFTWRCWADGGQEGPISQGWNVQAWPTVFILDERGVIRYKELRDELMGKAVDELLRAMAK